MLYFFALSKFNLTISEKLLDKPVLTHFLLSFWMQADSIGCFIPLAEKIPEYIKTSNIIPVKIKFILV